MGAYSMIKTAFQYHEQTSYERGKIGGHYLDWYNQPTVFKEYHDIAPVPLPEEIPSFKKSLSSVLKETDIDPTYRKIDINNLSLILRLTYTITAKTRQGRGEFYYRSAASAGALYPTEIYVATRGIKGIGDGLYHYAIHRHGLSPLRSGDFAECIRGLVFSSAGKLPTLTFIFTAIFFRSSWKYRDRAYRYHLLDTGHVIENLGLALKAMKLPYYLSYEFIDNGINNLIGLDDEKEACLALVSIPGLDNVTDSEIRDIEALPDDNLKASIVSKKEIDYPAIHEIHRAGYMHEAKDYLEPDIQKSPSLIPETWYNLAGLLSITEKIEYPGCLFKRRSSRNFINQAISKNTFFSLLDYLCVDENNMPERTIRHQSLTVGFLAGNIESIDSGLYVLDAMKKRFGMVTNGNFIGKMTRACLDQDWLRNAGVHFLFICDLNLIDMTYGPRGYRHVLMKAGRLGESIYIASTSLGLGCCGIGAFYDDEAADLIGLNRDSRLMYLVAVGKVKRM
jgi:SagB-type dehydrogenase family enzyme